MKINIEEKKKKKKRIFLLLSFRISNICSGFEALDLKKNHAADMLLVQNK